MDADELEYKKARDLIEDQRQIDATARSERDLTLKTEELDLKKKGSKHWWVGSAASLVIGALTVLSSGAALFMTVRTQSSIAQANAESENKRAEHNSIISILALSDPEKVRAGLCAVVSMQMVSDQKLMSGVTSYVNGSGGCNQKLIQTSQPASSSTTPATAATPKPRVETASLLIPGCGTSGCYLNYNVCGLAPPGTTLTGKIVGYTDSFGGAFGDWAGPPTVSSTSVCRVFTQHSHNQARTVTIQYEVQSTS